MIWLALAGWWLAMSHVVMAVGPTVTVVVLPLGHANMKLAAPGCARFGICNLVVSADERRGLPHCWKRAPASARIPKFSLAGFMVSGRPNPF